ncbi:MAG: arylsulfotransferase family protein [Isosphaeraceae bacterium]|nr:arylsulfotransferase family protein [Isosphaeraceae bacterium]
MTHPFPFLFDRPRHRRGVPGPRPASLRLEALESRELLSSSSDVWNFITAPKLHPMKVNVQVQEPGTAPGLNFVAPYAVSQNPSDLVGQTGPLIMDNSGNPVWFQPLSSTNKKQATDFRVQSYRGQPVLTWWQGTLAGTVPTALPNGTALPGAKYVVYNDHYQKIMTVKARNGFTADVHEFLITPQGDALFIATKVVRANLTPYGGVKNGAFVDPEVQEINLRTGKLVFAWNMDQHVPLSECIVPAPTSANQIWDAYHMNAIDEGPNGELLLSARNTWALYEISNPAVPGGGQVLWQLAGKPQTQWPQFTMANDITGPYNSAFQWQHDAQFQPVTGTPLPPGQTEISLFDDACCDSPFPDPFSPAQGLILNLDANTMMASVQKSYPHDPSLFPSSQGNVEALANGDEFIGWGAEPDYSEYTQSGTALYDVVMPGDNISYRAFHNPWVGLPLTKPATAITQVAGQRTVYASWNGSTQTAAWELLAGRSPASLSPVSITPRTGFQTAMATEAPGPFYEVKALDDNGAVLKTSAVISVLSPKKC